MENKDKPIYPIFYNGAATTNDSFIEGHHSLTKREYFAAMAMQGWIACQHDGFTSDAQGIAKRSIECADELLKQLEDAK